MARNCAVIVGINDYDEISPLKYAKSDAERMRDFFMQDLGVSQDDLYFFTDDSPRNAQGRKTQPTYGTLKSFLGDRFENPFLSAGDTLWFYFSGHGMPCEGRDYLLPSDGNPRSMPALGIAISDVTERLRRSGADNVVMLIDACRSDGAKNAGMGIGEEKQQGVITFFSCSPSQVSYEIDEIGQGAFTNVLLEALRIQGEGNCATVERFANYLKDRVPQVTQRYKQYRQVPYVKIEPETKLHYLLLPKFANLTDIALLRENALEAENEGDYDLAFQLWLRVNVAAGGSDMKAVKAFQRLANKQMTDSSSKPIVVTNISHCRTIISGNQTISGDNIAKVSPKIELRSAKGINYRELERLLQAKEWREADELTAKLMLEVSGQPNWLEEEHINIFPCKDLETIDQLWVHHSNGKFGFSVQNNIWLECGGKIGQFEEEVWKRFAAKVGWYHPSKDEWRTYKDFMQETQNFQKSLPASLPRSIFWGELAVGWLGAISALGHKLTICLSSLELPSAKGIDYRELEQLLKAQEWRKSDELTHKLICQVADRIKEGWLDIEHINNFPYEDLHTIDQLWVNHSNGKFGFSVQKKLWLACGGKTSDYDMDVFKRFAENVGWYQRKGGWRTYDKFMNETQNAQSALLASLPALGEVGVVWDWTWVTRRLPCALIAFREF